jgi:flavin reductase (DIM6/NTAB) family NADH-FMN oxidoreductase RutF
MEQSMAERYFSDATSVANAPPLDILPVAADLFKTGMRRLTGGVAVATARGGDGSLVGMTVTSVCSLTAEPPMLLVCANKAGSFASHVQRGTAFCVNLLSAADENVARACAGMVTQSGEGRFDSRNWRIGADGTPILSTALARFHCVASELIPASTHMLTIGRVWDVHLSRSDEAALAYREGRYVNVR